MGRRLIVRKDDIYKRRAEAWEFHYQNRETAKQLSSCLDVTKILITISREVPSPELDITGRLITSHEIDQGINKALDCLRWTWKQRDLICLWYWSELHWMEFVRAFQKLPDVFEDYYWLYSKKTDDVKLVPMSSKPKQGSRKMLVVETVISGTSAKTARGFQNATVENPVESSGTTTPKKVQVPRFETSNRR